MSPRLVQWGVAVAAIVLLGSVLALAVTSRSGHDGSSVQPEGDFVALAGSSGPAAFGRRTACGGVIHTDTLGVAHPTLPCGVRIFLTFRGIHVLTQVIDRGPSVPGRQFDVTDALARRLGLSGVQQLHWAYARAG